MTVDPDVYRPPFLTQHARRLSKDGIDDCRVVSGLHLAAAASLGECIRTRFGNFMQMRGLAKLAQGMRDSLGPDKQEGGLSIDDEVAMLAWLDPDYKPTRPHVTVDELWQQLGEGYAFSVSGQAAGITVDTPLKRTSGPHEWMVLRLDKTRENAIVYDPFRSAGTAARGEPASKQVLRQFLAAYIDSGFVGYALRAKVGGWTKATLVRRQMLDEQAELRAKLKRCRDECQDGQTDCAPVAAAARDLLLDELEGWVAGQRGEG